MSIHKDNQTTAAMESIVSINQADSLESLKATFDYALSKMTDDQIIEAFREAGCEVTIEREDN